MKTPMRMGSFALLVLLAFFFGTALSQAQDSTEATRKILVKTTAVYPTLAQSMNIRGVVKLEALISPNGTVKSVIVKGGHPILTQSAVNAVGHWKFEPASHETKEQIEIKFDPQ